MFKNSDSEASVETREDGASASWLLGPGNGDPENGFVGLVRLAAGTGLPVHRHENAEEAIVVLEGDGVHSRGGEEEPAPAGTVLYAPRGSWHTVRAVEEPLKVLVIYGGVPDLESAGYEVREDDNDRSGPEAKVVRIDDIPDEGFHDPDQGFYRIAARWIISADTVASADMVVGRSTFDADGGLHDVHRHPGAEEFLFVIEGKGAHLFEDGTEKRVGVGDAILVSRNEWHGFRTDPGVRTRLIFGYLGASSLEAGGYELPAVEKRHADSFDAENVSGS